jgi:hypothetical protein
MRTYRVLMPLLALGLACQPADVAAQLAARALTPIFPNSELDQSGGCFSIRCFMYLEGFDGSTAITSNTPGALGVQVRAPGPLWSVQQAITNPDNPPPPPPPRMLPPANFGAPAAISGDVILVKGSSSRYAFKDVIYAFARSAGQWTHTQTFPLQRPAQFDRTIVTKLLMDGDIALINGVRTSDSDPALMLTRVDVYKRGANGLFGRREVLRLPGNQAQFKDYALGLDGAIAVVADPDAGGGAGRAYVFENGAAGWIRTRTLLSDAASAGNFGESVAVYGNTIAIAEPGRPNATAPTHAGAVHVFSRTNGQWIRTDLLLAPDRDEEGFTFGYRVALSGNRLLVATKYNEFSSAFPAFAFLFERRNGWVPVGSLEVPELLDTGEIALSGATAILRADDFAYSQPGYVYDLPLLGTLPAQ